MTTDCFTNIEIHIIMSVLVTKTNVIPFCIAENISYMNMCKYQNEKICHHGDLNQGPLVGRWETLSLCHRVKSNFNVQNWGGGGQNLYLSFREPHQVCGKALPSSNVSKTVYSAPYYILELISKWYRWR